MKLGELEACARAFILAGFEMLKARRVLPRPRVRYLEMGRDYFGPDLMDLPQFAALAQAVARTPTISNIHRCGAQSIGDFFRPYLETLFERILNDTTDNEVDDVVLDRWFNKFKSELLSPTATFVHIWALEGLDMDVLDARIDDDTVIRHLAPHELYTMLETNVGKQGWARDKQLSWHGTCALIVTHRASKVDMIGLIESPDYPIEKFLLTLQAMHLHKEGNVSAPLWISFHQADFPLTRPLVIQRRAMGRWFDPHYYLAKSDVGAIRQLFEDVYWLSKSAPQADATTRKLRLALGFFESSYDLKRYIDSLVDLCIALEALFLQERQELSYRLAHRVAALLGTDDKNSQQLFERIRALYKLRSAYVHGDPLSAEKESRLLARIADAGPNAVRTWVAPILVIEDCVRQSLKLMIRMRRKNALNLNSSFYEKIDQFVLDKKARLKFQRSVGLVAT